MVDGRAGPNTRTYRCSNSLTVAKRQGKACPAPANVTASLIEEAARDFLLEGLPYAPIASLGDPDEALALAEAEQYSAVKERDHFAADMKAREILGDAYYAALLARTEAVSQATERLRQIRAAHQPQQIVYSEDLLRSADLTELGELVRGALTTIVVTKGRQPVTERLDFIWQGVDAPIGIASLQNG